MESPLVILTPHDDGHVDGGLAEGVGQDEGVRPRVVSVRFEDHQAPLPHQVVRVGVYGFAVEEPRLLHHHSLPHAVQQSEVFGALHSRIWLRPHDHILESFCRGEGDRMEEQQERKTAQPA